MSAKIKQHTLQMLGETYFIECASGLGLQMLPVLLICTGSLPQPNKVPMLWEEASQRLASCPRCSLLHAPPRPPQTFQWISGQKMIGQILCCSQKQEIYIFPGTHQTFQNVLTAVVDGSKKLCVDVKQTN